MKKQPFIDFIISNPGHHAEMMKPVMAGLIAEGRYRVRLLSLCEFRGLASPVGMFAMNKVDFIRLTPFHFRSPSSGGSQMGTSRQQWSRRLLRLISWELLLHWRFRRLIRQGPEMVVVPNDAAFPYNKIVTMLKTAEIPFVLMQEGIRFPLPGSEEGDAYGQGGAAAIAAWGEGSAAYFRSRGVSAERVVATGNPRFDNLLQMDNSVEAEKLRISLGLQNNTLLFMTNPIDDQGFCTTQEKYELVGKFVDGISPLFEMPDFRLVIKLHPRENISEFQKMINTRPTSEKIRLIGKSPLNPLFVLSKGAVVLASTVGLEALMMGIPLGVLEIPGTGFVYDYVERGAAIGLTWDKSIVDQVCEMLTRNHCDKQAVEDYIKYSLTTLHNAAETVVELINQTVRN